MQNISGEESQSSILVSFIAIVKISILHQKVSI